MSIGELLKKLREDKKLSLRDAGKLSGLSHSYISAIETGKHPSTKSPISPTPDTLKKLSEAYDYPYQDLLIAAGYIDSQLILDIENGSGTRLQTIEETEREREVEKQHEEHIKRSDIGYILKNNTHVYFERDELSAEEINKIYDMIVLMRRK